jgi:hypothetical protein
MHHRCLNQQAAEGNILGLAVGAPSRAIANGGRLEAEHHVDQVPHA